MTLPSVIQLRISRSSRDLGDSGMCTPSTRPVCHSHSPQPGHPPVLAETNPTQSWTECLALRTVCILLLWSCLPWRRLSKPMMS